MRIPEDLSKETQERIVRRHVQHFEALSKRAEAGHPNVRGDECAVYLATWLSGQAALQLGEPLPADCVQEMQDAVWSGDSDEDLTADELAKLEAWLAEEESE